MTNSELKSKVMTLGNRLAPRMGDRTAAFVQAWIIVKAGGLEVVDRNVSFENWTEGLKRLADAPEQIVAFLAPLPKNVVDLGAVAVMVGDQSGRRFYRIGYIPRNLVPAVAPAADLFRGQLPRIRLVDGDIRGARVRLAV